MLETLVWLVVQLIVLAVCGGLLLYLCDYVASQFPQTAPIMRGCKVLVVVVAVLCAVLLLARFSGV
jgi:uncharacterized membrane-anchored protein